MANTHRSEFQNSSLSFQEPEKLPHKILEKHNNEAQLQQELVEQSKSVIEISSLQDLEAIPTIAGGKQIAIDKLKANDTSPESIMDLMELKFSLPLSNLLERAREGNKKVFVVDFGQGPWAVVAASPEEITSVESKLRELSALMVKLNPNRTCGFCGMTAEISNHLHVSDGEMAVGYPEASTRYPAFGQSQNKAVIYDVSHAFNYADIKEANKTIYFDLTSQSYAFSLGSRRNSSESWLKGMAVIEDIGQQTVTENIYQNDNLTRVPFTITNYPEEKIKSHTTHLKQSLFTDNALTEEGVSRAAQ